MATNILGEDSWTKRDRESGEFISQKKAPAEKPYKGVRKEKRGRTC
jgi:hypothetical protein